jgi:hypothetical protein
MEDWFQDTVSSPHIYQNPSMFKSILESSVVFPYELYTPSHIPSLLSPHSFFLLSLETGFYHVTQAGLNSLYCPDWPVTYSPPTSPS